MKKIATFIIVIMGLFGLASAQGDYEALTFSQFDYWGTARFVGAGGAFGATGGDFSALSTNPAAIGLFKRYETSVTPMQLNFGYTDTWYNGDKSSAQKFKYTVPQAGVVLARDIRLDNGWKKWQFGFGYNRITDFNQTFRANTQINKNIRIDHLALQVSVMEMNVEREAITSKTWYMVGSKLTATAETAGNYGDKLFIGATLGFPFLDFKENVTYKESPADFDDLYGINSYTLYSTQRNSGTGVNFKIGAIYQPADFVRIGASFHTPTYYWTVKDYFYRELVTKFAYPLDNGATQLDYTYENANSFSLTTPLKFNVDASFLIAKRAFIAAEYEYQDYGMAKLYADNYDYIVENQTVKAKYGASHTVRVGAEVNVTQGFALRAGYRLKTSPYKLTEAPYNNTAHFISAGLGFRGKVMFFDLAYVLRMCKDSYWLYDSFGTPCNIASKTHSVVATIGCKF